MKNDCMEYAKAIAEELESVYAGESEECEDLYDYVAQSLDIEYRINRNGSLKGAYIYVTLGGPNAWIDTLAETVEVRWGLDEGSWTFSKEVAAELDGIAEEIFECIR